MIVARARYCILVTSLCLIGLLAFACSDDSADSPSPTPTAGSPSPMASIVLEITERWDESGTWMPIFDELEPCGNPIALYPEENAEDAVCISGLAREVSPGTADFFDETNQFLFEFEDRPGIDTGWAGAPWFNMGRGELVFLNTSPDVIFAAAHVPLNWSSNARYEPLLGNGLVFAWFEYADVESRTLEDDGGEVFVVTYTLQECRVCEIVGTLRVSYGFDDQRKLSEVEVLSPGEPDSP